MKNYNMRAAFITKVPFSGLLFFPTHFRRENFRHMKACREIGKEDWPLGKVHCSHIKACSKEYIFHVLSGGYENVWP